MSLSVTIRHPLSDFSLDVNFSVPSSGVSALFGPSGAGKSSVIKAIAGLLRPRNGYISLDGEPLFDASSGLFVKPRFRRIGYVFQEGRLFPHMNVRANLLYGWRRTGKTASAEEIDRIIALLGLERLLNRGPGNLSGGERQRVALGRALLADSRLLLLDEPLSGLDDARRREIMPWLENLRDEARLPIIYVSHAVDEVARLADHIVLMDEGRVKALGPVQQVLSRLDLMQGSAGDVQAVLLGDMVRIDAGHGLSQVSIGRESLFVPRPNGPNEVKSGRLRIQIAADDVMLATERPEAISANNVLKAHINALSIGDEHVHVKLDCEGQSLLAHITRLSYERLCLKEDMTVYAIIKTVRLVP